MIIFKLQGGLGNQLFQYAAYAKIREKFDDCWFDISEYDPPRNKGYREFLLEFFNTIDLNLIAFTDNKRKLLLDKVFKTYFFNKKVLLLPSTEKEKYFFINHIQARELASDFSELKDNTYLEGYFANTRFFPNDFFSSFYFKNTYLERIKNPLLEKIKQTNSVSVHIRRGDYLNEPQYHNICTHEYYDKAINEIKNYIDNPVFFFFSDDIEWVKKNYTDKSYFFIQKDKSYISPTVDDLFFMSSCKHNILANSTYSWWGAYLNKNPKKIIIRPKYFANTSADDSIYPKGWKKI